ncbi:MAG: DUF4352 domain-containing protein [Leptonema illini]|jgi:hypothetical protein|uniref:DUF4352 domain-containing protein n=1 Tax=Leptonema illini TaxID=183 RepID=A0A833H005_9LEPT|nr:MAG: DUF4352 domain-containing protein [Leptonema illini]
MTEKNSQQATKWYSTKKAKIGIAVFAVLIVFAAMSGKDDNAKQDMAEPAVLPKVGEVYKTDNFEITVSSIRPRNSVGQIIMIERPSEGAVFVEVLFKYKNITQKPIGYGFPRIKLIDPNGVKYDEQVSASIQLAVEKNFSRKAISDLNPGVTSSDGKIFEVAAEAWKTPGWKIAVESDRDYEVAIP